MVDYKICKMPLSGSVSNKTSQENYEAEGEEGEERDVKERRILSLPSCVTVMHRTT